MISLTDFLRNSTIGPIYVGVPSHEVVQALGTAIETTETDDLIFWKYGALELTVTQSRVVALKLDCLRGGLLPAPFQTIVLPKSNTTLYEFLDQLDANSIQWEIDQPFSFDRQVCVLTQGGVRAYFDLDHRELQSLRL